MNLGDPEWELVDPTPDIYALFKNFDTTFFWSKLASRAVVRWSKRMYSCAGVCSYEGRGGLCDIALSEPLLKLRPRKNLIETLLHEMIHAYLFVTNQDKDRDGHGPTFKAHMHRINKSAGLNISIYHDFHDEVELYQTHWWRCNGPCQRHRPKFGIVRRTNNRAPGPSDWWWARHQKICGGRFIKIKEPENRTKQGAAKINKAASDITKFVIKTIKGNNNDTATKPVLKDSNNIKQQIKSKSPNTVLVNKKDVIFNPQVREPSKAGCSCNGAGHILSNRKRSASVDVVEQVRNVWANKQLINVPKTLTPPAKVKPIMQNANIINNKHIIQTVSQDGPKNKIMKIDDYYRANAVLKDVYGKDFVVQPSKDNKKLVAEEKKPTTSNLGNGIQNPNNRVSQHSLGNLVDCPICVAKVDSALINRHLDECLNKDIIEKLNKESIPVATSNSNVANTNINVKPKENLWQDIPKFNVNNVDIKLEIPELLDLSFAGELLGNPVPTSSKKSTVIDELDRIDPMEETVAPSNHNATSKVLFNDAVYLQSSSVDLHRILEKLEVPKWANIKSEHVCPCCGNNVNIPIGQHLEECLMFFNDNNTVPKENDNIETIVLDDDKFDDTLTLNATGTKLPCPCCLKMIEEVDMNSHLDVCLS